MSRLVTALRAVVPDFARRPLTWTSRRPALRSVRRSTSAPGVTRAALPPAAADRPRRQAHPTYRLFAAWHAIGHWVLHPGDGAYYLERGWLTPVERQASRSAGAAPGDGLGVMTPLEAYRVFYAAHAEEVLQDLEPRATLVTRSAPRPRPEASTWQPWVSRPALARPSSEYVIVARTATMSAGLRHAVAVGASRLCLAIGHGSCA
jgi:hypothetical protein